MREGRSRPSLEEDGNQLEDGGKRRNEGGAKPPLVAIRKPWGKPPPLRRNEGGAKPPLVVPFQRAYSSRPSRPQ